MGEKSVFLLYSKKCYDSIRVNSKRGCNICVCVLRSLSLSSLGRRSLSSFCWENVAQGLGLRINTKILARYTPPFTPPKSHKHTDPLGRFDELRRRKFICSGQAGSKFIQIGTGYRIDTSLRISIFSFKRFVKLVIY